MTDSEATRLLADMRARYMPQPYDADQDITLADIMAEFGVSDQTALRWAQAECAAGRLTVRKTLVAAHSVNVYRRKCD